LLADHQADGTMVVREPQVENRCPI